MRFLKTTLGVGAHLWVYVEETLWFNTAKNTISADL